MDAAMHTFTTRRGSDRRWACALALALGACGGGTATTGTATVPRAGTATGGETAANTPPEPALPEDATAQHGHALFDGACARCHGADGPGPQLANLNLTEQRMNTVLHAGSDLGGLMPAVAPSELAERDLPALVAFLRTIHAQR
jgi:mono/diheme cytochrome c family protein